MTYRQAAVWNHLKESEQIRAAILAARDRAEMDGHLGVLRRVINAGIEHTAARAVADDRPRRRRLPRPLHLVKRTA